MNKLKTGEIISICSILASILVVALKGETSATTQIVIISLFATFILAYGIYLTIRSYKNSKGISSAAIIANAKKFSLQLLKLANANKKQLKKFDFLNQQKNIEKQNKRIAAKCGGDISKLATNEKHKLLKRSLSDDIRKYTIQRSENYGDLEALKGYNRHVKKVMSEATLEQNYLICRNIIKRVFDMSRILLQVEQHNVRIKLGRYVAYFTNEEETQIKAYMDLIGWSYILLGDNKSGFAAILNAIHIIESKIGESDEINIPKNVSPETYFKYLFLKVRAYRHLGSTYYTFKNINAMMYCNLALKILDQPGFKTGLNDDTAFFNMRCGVLNNLYLCEFYKFVKDCKKGKGDIERLKRTLNSVNADIDEVNSHPAEARDQHRLIKLLSLKCQLTKALDISGACPLDTEDFAQNLKQIETALNKNIYFDDAMEVYTNQKIQQVYEETKNILTEE